MYIKGMISVNIYTVQTAWIKIETAVQIETQLHITAHNSLHLTHIVTWRAHRKL